MEEQQLEKPKGSPADEEAAGGGKSGAGNLYLASQSLRHRGPAGQPAPPEHQHQQPKKKKKKSLKWTMYSDEDSKKMKPSAAQSQVFGTMQVRKMRRRVHGRKVKVSLVGECACLICTIILIFVLAVVQWGIYGEFDDDDDESEEGTSSTTATGSSTADIVLLVLWVLLAVIILNYGPFNPWLRMLKWMLLYIPLLVLAAEIAWYYDEDFTDDILLVLFIFSEVVVLCSFVGFYKIYPVCLKAYVKDSKKHDTAENYQRLARLCGVHLVSDWTMRYNSATLTSCYTCKYEGETDPVTGLPQGIGRWLDDSWEGETMTGFWKQGKPVAPFSSWSFGTDDAVNAVRVAYFIATDDPFDKNYSRPTNDKQLTPTCGVASVECSVSGAFYQHLPEADLLEGPYPPTATNFQRCIQDLDPIGHDEDDNLNLQNNSKKSKSTGRSVIEVRATDSRGIQVMGHVYQPTGKPYNNQTNQITVQVKRGSDADDEVKDRRGSLTRQTAIRRFSKNMFLPRASRRSTITSHHHLFGGGSGGQGSGGAAAHAAKILMVDIEESSSEDDDDSKGPNYDHITTTNGEEKEQEDDTLTNRSKNISVTTRPSLEEQEITATLHVQDWIPAQHKEALIFLPGYNSTTNERLSYFGQFLAMSKLSTRVYPFVFCWPGGVGPGYLYASTVAGNQKNFDNLLELVQSVRAAGIRTVHLMTHSMGAQALLGAMQDEYDENGNQQSGQGRRSKLSRCFQLDPSCSRENRSMRQQQQHDESEHQDDDDLERDCNHKLICKTITMLNPDFPLEAFVNRGFLTLRKICRTITVVGDRNDGALYWSSVINAAAERLGYEHCSALRQELSPPTKKRPFRLQERIGRSIDSLHFPKGESPKSKWLVYQNLLSFGGAVDNDDSGHIVRWLDMDVIDMTGLDTNIAGLRHSGYTLNGMLLKDLEELFRTGKRAMKRSTLVYREGNMFSYAHAPSFVSM